MIRLCLRAHGDSFDPVAICHKKIVQAGGPQEKVHDQLAALIPKGSLRQFIEQHPEFEYVVESPGDRPRIRYAPAAYGNPRAAAPGALSAALSGALPNPHSAAPDTLSSVQLSGASVSAAPAPRDQQNDGSLNAAASGATSYYVLGPVNPDLRGQGRGEGGGDEGLTDFWINGPGREWRRLGRGWPSGGPLGS